MFSVGVCSLLCTLLGYSGSKELCGAVDLLSYYKLWPHHEIFCKRSLPLSLSETPYLHNVVGEKKIRKGEGMELDQLLRDSSSQRGGSVNLQPFQLDILRDAFRITETATSSNHSYVRKKDAKQFLHFDLLYHICLWLLIFLMPSNTDGERDPLGSIRVEGWKEERIAQKAEREEKRSKDTYTETKRL